MPIKWNITAKAMKARGIMDQISAEYDGFIEGGTEHLADVKGLRSQVGEMQDDLTSAANVMGNSGGASNGYTEAVQPATVPLEEFLRSPVFIQPDPPNPPQQPPAAPPAAILNGSPGMRAEYQAARADVQLIRS